jgi:flagellar biosynthesis protein FliR
MAAFFASGGHLAVVCGALETFTTLPVGSWPHASLEKMCSLVPGLSLHLAISMAMPAMMALVAMHLVTTIIVRIAPLSPGSGLVQAAGAVVLLFSMFVGADTWARGWGEAISAPLERILAFDH